MHVSVFVRIAKLPVGKVSDGMLIVCIDKFSIVHTNAYTEGYIFFFNLRKSLK